MPESGDAFPASSEWPVAGAGRFENNSPIQCTFNWSAGTAVPLLQVWNHENSRCAKNES
jgi:hypothetical protein